MSSGGIPYYSLRGAVRGVRSNLFSSVPDALITVIISAALVWACWSLFRWGILEAVGFWGSSQECRGAQGACWAAIGSNIHLFLFGTYPIVEQWRPIVAFVIIAVSFSLIMFPRFRRWKVVLPVYTSSVAMVLVLLLGGGWSRLSQVDADVIGGLMLTFFICWVALPMALPIALILALARQSPMPAIRVMAVSYIELVRGLPLIVVLFMAAVLFPLFFESGSSMAKVFRAMLGICLFAAAYLAEVIRGGLQAIPSEQLKAAESLGLRYWQIQRKIVLPQVFPIVVRPLSGMYISFFKNTSLVSVIGLFELVGITTIVITKPEWAPFSEETYLIVGLVYALCCWAMSRLATSLERQLMSFAER